VVDGYPYFPPGTVRWQHLRSTTHTSSCAWKGAATYFDVAAGGKLNREAAWVYQTPKPAAQAITGHVGFWKGVKVEHS
jgi:uncharacterized protein (DUF427 family)